jgi:hypothetical protein
MPVVFLRAYGQNTRNLKNKGGRVSVTKSADRYFQLDSDMIQEIGYNPDYSLESESVFSLANEHMGVRG